MLRPPATPAMPRTSLATLLSTLLGSCVFVACQSDPGMPSPEALATMVEEEQNVSKSHVGPPVELGASGPARFVRTLYNGFRQERAMETVRFMDARYRSPGSPGFRESFDLIERELRAVGFGAREDLELEVIETEMEDAAWMANGGELRLITSTGGESILHAFDHPSDPERCLLPENARAAKVRGTVCLGLSELQEGQVLVTEAALRRDLLQRAERKGAVAVVSASRGSYNVDPTGRERHVDGIRFRSVARDIEIAVAQISPRSYGAITEAVEAGGAELALEAEVEAGGRKVRTLIATVVGSTRADEVIAMSSHLEAPGANDNASGAAGQLENALTLARVLEGGGLERPARSIAFIWGMENDEATIWLERQERKPVAAVNAVMIGESRAQTGAVPLLERYPDPGAVKTIAPDKHTLWGSRDIEPEWLVPNGLSIVARCALVDVASHSNADDSEAWETFENPYEGGTDHERFISSEVPAVLFWHFTDFTFHTSLDRMEMVDSLEMKRMAVAALATGMALADPVPADLTRYLRSLDHERRLRVAAAEEAGEFQIAEDWRAWCSGVRHWFRIQCLGLEGEEGVLPGPLVDSAAEKQG